MINHIINLTILECKSLNALYNFLAPSIINLTILECKFGVPNTCLGNEVDNKSNHIGM